MKKTGGAKDVADKLAPEAAPEVAPEVADAPPETAARAAADAEKAVIGAAKSKEALTAYLQSLSPRGSGEAVRSVHCENVGSEGHGEANPQASIRHRLRTVSYC